MKLTPIQTRILCVLSDGKPHMRRELLACLLDEYATYFNLNVHMTMLRHKLRPIGYDLVCELRGKSIHYRWVRNLHRE